MSLNPEIIYESSLMANISYEDLIKLAQIYTVGRDITDHMCELVEKEVIANQKHYQNLLKTTKPSIDPENPQDDTFPYPLKPEGMDDDTYAYNVIVECLRDPNRAEEYVGVGSDYDLILEHSKTLKTITEEKKNAAKLTKPLTDEEISKLSSLQKMKRVISEYEPCDEIKLMIINHIENRNGGLSNEMQKNKEAILGKVKNFQAEFELAGKEAKKQSRVINSWNKISDEICAFFLRSDAIKINPETQEKYAKGYTHKEPNGKEITLTAKFENGHVTINDGKTDTDRMSLYVRKSNTTIPPTLHISFRGTEGDHFINYILHDYGNMKNHFEKMKPIIDDIIKQELLEHKKNFGDTPLNIHWSGHSLGAACASIALKNMTDNSDIKNTGAFFGMPEVVTGGMEAAKEVVNIVKTITKDLGTSNFSKVKKFINLGAESIVASTENYNNVKDNRAIAINQEGDIITASRRSNEKKKETLNYPTINIVKDTNNLSIKHHSALDYSILTKNLLDTFTLTNFIKDIKNNSPEINNIHEYYVGDINRLILESSKKTILDRLANIRNDSNTKVTTINTNKP